MVNSSSPLIADSLSIWITIWIENDHFLLQVTKNLKNN